MLDRGRLVIQDELDVLQRPTGRTYVRTPDVAQVRALLDGEVERHDERQLLVRVPDVAALNARLVTAGVRVVELAPERHTLEDVVLAATPRRSRFADRLERRHDRGRAEQADAQPPDLDHDRC